MRANFCLCIVLTFAVAGPSLQCQKNDGIANVKGSVVGANSLTTVYIKSLDDNPTRYYDGYEVTAEQDGSFVFNYVKPGTYRIDAQANGFMLDPKSGITSSTITLHPGEILNDLKIAMVPRMEVCGRLVENGSPNAIQNPVIKMNGVPLRNSFVVPWSFDPEFGTFSRKSFSSTTADGTYHLSNLEPGIYFLQADTTWYPGVASFSDAKPVVVGPGTKMPAECTYDIPLQYTGCYATKVHGSIAHVPGMEDQQFMVSFRQHSTAGGSVVARIAFIGDKTFKGGDSFEDRLCPGTYDVLLTDNTRMSWENEILRHKVVFDTQEITVGADEVNGLVLTPHPLVTVYGQVEFDDTTRRDICPARGGQYVAILREGDGQFQNVDLGQDGRFQFKNVAPGEYQIYIGSILREAVFLKSLVVNGKSYRGRQFTVPEASPITMVITLSGDVAHAEGHVSPDVRGDPRWDVAWMRPRANISGKIAGGPLDGLTVKLRSVRYNSDASYEYTTSPKQDGTFHFEDVDPGAYTIRAEGKDYVTSEYGAMKPGAQGIPIVLPRGASESGMTLSPLKLSAICGKVVDSGGAPQPNVRIFVETFSNRYMRGGGSNPDHIVTDENGLFRAEGFAPGDYFIAYPGSGSTRFFSSDGSLRADTPLHLVAGEDAGCAPAIPLELRFPSNANSRYRVTGTVTAKISKEVGDRFWVSVIDEREDGAQVFIGSSKLDANQSFSIENVPNGQYVIQLHSGYGPEPRFWSGPYPPVTHLLATQQIEVNGADVSGVNIEAMELPSVRGQVHFTNLPEDWKGKTFEISQQWISLIPRWHAAPMSAKLSSEGSFEIAPEDVGDYEVDLRIRSPLYISSVRLNGTEIQGRYFHLAAGSVANLEVEVRGDGGKINFSVTPDSSLPIPEPHVDEVCRNVALPALEGIQIVLLPDPLFADSTNPASSVEKPVLRATRVSDGNKTFLQITGVPPGRYRAIAAERLSAISFPNPHDVTKEERSMLEALADMGTPLTVESASAQEIEVPDKTLDVAHLAARTGLAADATVLGTR